MTTLSGKVALVTGGTSGIGKAAAIALAQAGAKVVVAGRRQAEGEETIRQIQAIGGDGFFVATDVSKEADVQTLPIESDGTLWTTRHCLEQCWSGARSHTFSRANRNHLRSHHEYQCQRGMVVLET